MLQMINDSEYLYVTMIRDLYYLGQILAGKYKHIRKSLNIFIFGFTVTVLSIILIRIFIGVPIAANL